MRVLATVNNESLGVNDERIILCIFFLRDHMTKMDPAQGHA